MSEIKATKNALGEYLVERLRAILPDYEVKFRESAAMGTYSEYFQEHAAMLEILIRGWGREEWQEDFHDDKNMATRANCKSLHFHLTIPPRDFAMNSDPERARNFRRHLLDLCLKQWVDHRLQERGLEVSK